MPTMNDIAVRAGVSRSTVSFVLNEKHDLMGVNEATRHRVLRIADEMGYRRNGLARAIATGKMPIFGFLIDDSRFESEVTARVLNGIMDEAENCRHTVQVLRLSGKHDEDVIQRCVELRPSGVMGIYLGREIMEHVQQEMSRFSIPVAGLDSTFPFSGGIRILSDDIAGCDQAISHLIGLGHRRIAFIGGNPAGVAGHLREEGFRRAMARHGLDIPPGYLQSGWWDIEEVEKATQRLFRDLDLPPTAVFCADDKTALIACREIHACGLRVPEDVSLVGYADLPIPAYCAPPLTTIAQPFREIGQNAVRQLLLQTVETGQREDASEECHDKWLPTSLVVRRSTAPVKG